MNRRTLTTIVLLGLAVATALPQIAFAQTDSFLGTWQLNLAKSKYSPGPPPKSGTMYIRGEGQTQRNTAVNIDAEGNPGTLVTMRVFDGQPHPVTGSNLYDETTYTRIDAYSNKVVLTKAGKFVSTIGGVLSQDGKTYTLTTTGTDANGRQINNISVYDKQ
jgi:hypothetical protein